MREKLLNNLFSEDYETYVILDGAVCDDLYFTIKHIFEIEYFCLYTGQDEKDLANVAPYLIQLKRESEFTDWVLEGYGKNWGIFIQSPYGISALYSELSYRTKIIDEKTGNNFFMRFYDPRAILKYLKIQSVDEVQSLFYIAPIFLYENFKKPSELYKTIFSKNDFMTSRIQLG